GPVRPRCAYSMGGSQSTAAPAGSRRCDAGPHRLVRREPPRYTGHMSNEPNLELLWSAFTGYQRTAAIKAAIELDVFTAIAAGADTVDAVATRTKAAARGVRTLLDHLTMDGFLRRDGAGYELTPTAAVFLDRAAPTYIGSVIGFVSSPHVVSGFTHLTEAVRRGRTAIPAAGSLVPDPARWAEVA